MVQLRCWTEEVEASDAANGSNALRRQTRLAMVELVLGRPFCALHHATSSFSLGTDDEALCLFISRDGIRSLPCAAESEQNVTVILPFLLPATNDRQQAAFRLHSLSCATLQDARETASELKPDLGMAAQRRAIPDRLGQFTAMSSHASSFLATAGGGDGNHTLQPRPFHWTWTAMGGEKTANGFSAFQRARGLGRSWERPDTRLCPWAAWAPPSVTSSRGMPRILGGILHGAPSSPPHGSPQ